MMTAGLTKYVYLIECIRTDGKSSIEMRFSTAPLHYPENQNYIIPCPEPKMYGADEMLLKKRKEVTAWVRRQQAVGKVFHFQRELAAYCRLDADVLRQGVESFRKGSVQTHGVDPLRNLTIAQACQKRSVQNFLREDTMATASVRPVPVRSIEAKSWLRHVESTERIDIEREWRLPDIEDVRTADGVHHAKRTLFFYYGCY